MSSIDAPVDVQPFRIQVSNNDLADLRYRLERTRWPDAIQGVGWTQGVPLDYLKGLAEYWRDCYDWRAYEARFNSYPQYMATIDGAKIHFLHIRSTEPTAVPLLLLHGWPGSIVEFLPMLDQLTNPQAFGGDASDAFHLIVPSMPGYGFSGPTTERGWHPWRIAHAYAALMKALSYPRYGAHGSDWGSRISRDMGVIDPEHIFAVHTTLLRAFPDPGESLTADELERLADVARFDKELNGYMKVQNTRPQTLSYGLTDSPVGQLAWIVEKFKDWADAPVVPEDAVGRDLLLTNVMFYWLTRTANSSARAYWEHYHWEGNDLPDPRLNWNTPIPSSVPTGVAVFPRELFRSLRRFGERTNNIIHWVEYDKGGHFPGLEVPDQLTADIRTFFRMVR